MNSLEEEKKEDEEPHVPVIVDHINAIEADELMSDELALALVIEEDENGDPAEEENENEAAEKTGDLDVDGACVIVATTARRRKTMRSRHQRR